MPLYLTKAEKEVILSAVKGVNWHVHRSIISKINTDNERLKKMVDCDHIHTSYSGKRECCGKCGSFFLSGMGDSWNKMKHTRKK